MGIAWKSCVVGMAAVLALLLLPSGAAASVLPSVISEETMLSAAGSPYTGDSTIEAGVTVKVDAGVEFSGVNLTVKGTLLVEGTSSDPVVFTGGGRSALSFEPGSGASVVDHAQILKAGGEYCCPNIYPAISIKGSSPTITNSVVHEAKAGAISITQGGSPEISFSQISASKGWGITYSAAAGNSGQVNIHDNLVEGGGGGGISASTSGSAVTAKALSGNVILANGGVGLYYSGPDIPGGITDNTLSGNKTNLIEIGGTVASSSTWKDGGVEVKVTSPITVATGVTLKMTQGLYINAAEFTVKGTLLVEGTSSDPVVFTGGGRSALSFEPGSGASVVDHAQILKAGGEYCCPNIYPAISIKGSSPTITNSVVHEAKAGAISITQGGSPEISFSQISASKGWGITYSAAAGNSGQVNIHDNLVEGGGGGGISASTSGSAVTAKALSGNVILANGGVGLYYSGPDIPGGITDNTLSGNKTNLIEIGGTVASSSTWNNGGVEIKLTGDITVASGVTLKITQGVHFQMGSSKFTVKGTLNAEGTSADPIVFNEGTRSALVFEPGSGSSVINYAEVLKAGGTTCCGKVYPAIAIKGSSPTITNSTLRESSAPAIAVTESGSPRIEWDRFRKNAQGLTYSGTGKLAASNNDWGCVNGPKPAGCGDSVTANVEWKSAIQLPELAGSCFGKETQCGEGADPVSLATGQLSYSHRDLLLTNKSSVPLEFTRSYDSGNSTDTGLGPGWSQTGLASAMELPYGEVLVLRQDGRQDVFYKTEAGYKAPSGVTDVLAKVEGTFQLTTLEGTVYRFDSSGRIAIDHRRSRPQNDLRLQRRRAPGDDHRSFAPDAHLLLQRLQPHHAGQRLDRPRSQIHLLGRRRPGDRDRRARRRHRIHLRLRTSSQNDQRPARQRDPQKHLRRPRPDHRTARRARKPLETRIQRRRNDRHRTRGRQSHLRLRRPGSRHLRKRPARPYDDD